uniref:CD209 antigen-like protein E n=1 Tax=Seriola lalandi dorsalis TaxID=1841481 RepID=A0A3B4Z3P5_SERLL
MEEIYSNVPQLKPVNPKPSTNPTGKNKQTELCMDVYYHLSLYCCVVYCPLCSGPSSERRFHGVVLILGLLSVFLLVGLISLGVRCEGFCLTHLTEKTCPAGWRMFSGTCYLLSIQSASWEKAREDCRARGADLVIIDSLKEQEFLTKDIIKQESWIGLTDRNHEKTWKWIDGTPLTLKFWQKGQPDKGNGSPKWGEEDCAVIQPGMKADENWNDLRCDAFRPWICGKKLFSIK